MNQKISYFASTQLPDGVVVGALAASYGIYIQNNNNSVGWIYVDTNGLKKPNTNGKDIFLFHVTNQGIIPFGKDGEEKDDVWKFSACKYTGYGCTNWVLTYKNMNYLHSDKCS